ncbi:MULTISPECIES: hypothetical protein [Streptosporangium]|uniref:WxL domain-containing protein n=1 Tax=Streptosporangium brasiliense TaxID=47480 RepID=A0ABT9R4N3_9ACTN|nr:hypothetical protein [Streptosporangium brasiliense]MDP9864196.1 hypothetical protein [Streptosporangium brasiliense]
MAPIALLLWLGAPAVSAADSSAAGAGKGKEKGRETARVLRATELLITVPNGPVNLGTGAAGSTLSGSLGTVTVSDTRPGNRTWVATVSATDFTRAGGGTITKANISYWSGPTTAFSGTAVRVPGQLTAAQQLPLSTPVTAFTSTKGSLVAATSTSWEPTIVVNIPFSTIPGVYTGTITHSAA